MSDVPGQSSSSSAAGGGGGGGGSKRSSRPCVFRVIRVSGTMRKAEEEAIRRARREILRTRNEHEAGALEGVVGGSSSSIGTTRNEDSVAFAMDVDDDDDDDDDDEEDEFDDEEDD
jgi:ribonuclease P/MRP protein subunit POP5